MKIAGGHLYYSLGASAWYLRIEGKQETIKLSEEEYPTMSRVVDKARDLITQNRGTK